MSKVTLKVNGSVHALDVEPATPLLYILRNDLGLQGPRFGCGLGQCGACTVIINGAAVRSCVTAVSSVKSEITTLEGLSTQGRLHPLQQAWIEEQVAAVRLLPERTNNDREGNAGQDPESKRYADTRDDERDIMPLHDALSRAGRHQAGGEDDRGTPPGHSEGGSTMTTSSGIPKHVEEILTANRRSFLKSAGLLAVGFGVDAGALLTEAHAQKSNAGSYPDPDFHQLDSWIVIHENNTATFYVGKTDCGQGTGTGFRQLMSDELDIAFDQTSCIMGSTDNTVDQGGSGGSTAMERDSWPMRRAAAEARRVLLEMGSARLGVPVDQLAVSNCVITAKSDASKRVTYGELIAGKKFNVTLTGANVNAVTGVAKTKTVQELKYTGQSPQRYDIPAKVDGSLQWAVDVKLPGMVHARNVKPPFACAKLTGIDESSVRNIPGFIKVVNKGNYVAVVCEREEQAINAAKQLKTTWEKPATAPFPPSEELFNYMRAATPTSAQRPIVAGNPDAGICERGKNC